MKSFITILLGTALALGIFGMQMPSADSTMHGGMSAAEHSMMASECGSTTCTTTTPSDCAALCFVASGIKMNVGILPSQSLTLFILTAASILALVFSHQDTLLRLAFAPLTHFDPHLLLTTHKRE
ncbi:hypothetical protein A3D69_03730 [Candidatus Uhrbacteria bacterium RIFCSPHIGHO2_02_FULL_54_11]|uniref:Uncharacterized protein n=1 Tax=Candidatus Uhrbacteria bacterium GW2011_GWC2_53_7 TaxID=1618986 RepID=A0A0G2A6L6_9BACT|nr:MAG: hypothetical protein UY82_C0020G0003 [Candidatus Uhrbacteria bacterium GW2011_GWC2_53_7]OGL72654.1 MAG: hypothetical protein A3D69_03730 [Candidatus Uhrbacteria bacterium RIFCSPHIGHO2_02_FULL_54_11]